MEETTGVELVMVFADAEMQRLAESLVMRSQERGCLSNFRWASERDERRDSMIKSPERKLRPYLGLQQPPYAVLMWDHAGSGNERLAAHEVEELVVLRLGKAGWMADRVATIAIVPELEVVLRPAWAKVKTALAGKRGLPLPSDSAVLGRARTLLRRQERFEDLPTDIDQALCSFPKEVLAGLVDLLNLRTSPEFFADMGRQLSIPEMKGQAANQTCVSSGNSNAVARMASYLVRWFPGGNNVLIQS